MEQVNPWCLFTLCETGSHSWQADGTYSFSITHKNGVNCFPLFPFLSKCNVLCQPQRIIRILLSGSSSKFCLVADFSSVSYICTYTYIFIIIIGGAGEFGPTDKNLLCKCDHLSSNLQTTKSGTPVIPYSCDEMGSRAWQNL